MCVKLTTLLYVFRVLLPDEFEEILQEWSIGKASGIWISIHIVLEKCNALTLKDFKHYWAHYCDRDALQRGFFLHEVRRKSHSIFIFDRSTAQAEFKIHGKLPDAPKIRMWMTFLGLFHSHYGINRELLYTELFAIHTSHEQVSHTLAGSLFGVKASRLDLARTIDGLVGLGLIVPAVPRDAASSSINGPEEDPDCPYESKRTRQSLDGVGCDFARGLEFDEPHDIERLRVARGLIEGTERLSTLSDRGDLYILLTEEWLLTEAVYDQDVLSAVGGPEKVLEILLADKFKSRLRLLGGNLPALFASDERDSSGVSPALELPTYFLRNYDLRIMLSRYTLAGVGTSYIRDRERLLERVKQGISVYYKKQLFQPKDGTPLLTYFEDRARYRTGNYYLEHRNSVLAAVRRERRALDETSDTRQSSDTYYSQKKTITLTAGACWSLARSASPSLQAIGCRSIEDYSEVNGAIGRYVPR